LRATGVLSVGRSSDEARTAAATFPSKLEAMTQPAISARMTRGGEVPALRRMVAAAICEMPWASKAADMEKPARKSRMSGLKKAPVARMAAVSAGIGVPGAGLLELQTAAGT
jgi:hypothetical protein